MSDAHDPQDGAEALDEEVVAAGQAYPPDRPLGVEENPAVPESYAERDERYEPIDALREETFDPEWAEDAALVDVAQLVDPDDGGRDVEQRLIADAVGPPEPSAEGAAVRIVDEPGA